VILKFLSLCCSRDSDIWERLSGKSKMTLDILTDDWLLMMTGNIVPFNSISIEVIENSHTGFCFSTLLNLFSVIWLSFWWVETSSSRPVMEGTVGVSRSQPSLVGRPEPPVDVLGEEVRPVTPVKVTQTSRSPEVWNIHIDEPLNPFVLFPRLKRHKIHAPLPAVVPGVEPVPLGVPHAVVVVLPAEPVKVTVEPLDTALVNSIFAEKTIGEAKFPGSLSWISTAVAWEEFLTAGGLRSLGSVIHESSAIEQICHGGKQVSESIEKLGIGHRDCHSSEKDGICWESHVAGSSSETILL